MASVADAPSPHAGEPKGNGRRHGLDAAAVAVWLMELQPMSEPALRAIRQYVPDVDSGEDGFEAVMTLLDRLHDGPPPAATKTAPTRRCRCRACARCSSCSGTQTADAAGSVADPETGTGDDTDAAASSGGRQAGAPRPKRSCGCSARGRHKASCSLAAPPRNKKGATASPPEDQASSAVVSAAAEPIAAPGAGAGAGAGAGGTSGAEGTGAADTSSGVGAGTATPSPAKGKGGKRGHPAGRHGGKAGGGSERNGDANSVSMAHFTTVCQHLHKFLPADNVIPEGSRIEARLVAAIRRLRGPFVGRLVHGVNSPPSTAGHRLVSNFACREAAVERVEELMKAKEFGPAGNLVAYGRLHEYVKLQRLLTECVKKNQIGVLTKIAETGSEDTRRAVILTLHHHSQSKLAWRMIPKLGLEEKAFPEVRQARVLAQLNWLASSIVKETRAASGVVSPVAVQQLDGFLARHPTEAAVAARRMYSGLGPDSPITRRFVTVYALATNFPDVATMTDAEVRAFDLSPLPPLSEPVFALPAGVEVTVVESEAQLAACSPALAAAEAVGFDSEWEPRGAVEDDTGHDPVALLQLGIPGRVFLLDVPALQRAVPTVRLDALLSPVFNPGAAPDPPASGGPRLLGFSCSGDMKHLAAACPGLLAFKPKDSSHIIDLALMAGTVLHSTKKKRMSLSTLALELLGVPIDKRARMSNWGRRPLAPWQIEYAALDAHVLLTLYDKLLAKQAEAATGGVPPSLPPPGSHGGDGGDGGDSKAAPLEPLAARE